MRLPAYLAGDPDGLVFMPVPVPRPVKTERMEDALDRTSRRLDKVVGSRGRRDGEPIIRSGDQRLVRGFPYFVVLVVIIWLAAVVYLEAYTLADMINLVCLSFTFCFALLGVPCALMMPRGAFSGWFVLLYALALTSVLWVCSQMMDNFSFAVAIDDMLNAVGLDFPGLWGEFIGFLGTLAVVLFTSIGVTSVISAYMRTYIPGVFASMNRHAREGVRGKAERFFMVPEIIDVEEVVLDDSTEHLFDLRRSVSISVYLFVLGLLVSSYLFVNPYFLEVMSWKTMLSITLMLSMFTPALILPWQIVRCVGARVRSSAPRDYYLWEGAKHRLFTTFTAMGAFMMMFLLSVYLGNDVVRIIQNYLAFLIPLLMTSMMYGFVYANNFENEDREAICEGFEEARGAP